MNTQYNGNNTGSGTSISQLQEQAKIRSQPMNQPVYRNEQFDAQHTNNNNNNEINELARDIMKDISSQPSTPPPQRREHIVAPSMPPTTSGGNGNGNGNDVSSSGGIFVRIPDFLREPLLIVVIYVFLSMSFAKDTIGKYIKYINPDASGEVPFTGIVIYGCVLASIFALGKMIILNK